jgi:hypothetical protein
VSDRYKGLDSRFTGDIDWVQIHTGDDSHDHLITPEDRMNVAVARSVQGPARVAAGQHPQSRFWSVTVYDRQISNQAGSRPSRPW